MVIELEVIVVIMLITLKWIRIHLAANFYLYVLFL